MRSFLFVTVRTITAKTADHSSPGRLDFCQTGFPLKYGNAIDQHQHALLSPMQPTCEQL